MEECIGNGVEGFRAGGRDIPEEDEHHNCGTWGVEEYHTHVSINNGASQYFEWHHLVII